MTKRIMIISGVALSLVMLTTLPKKQDETMILDKIVTIQTNKEQLDKALTPYFETMYQQFDITDEKMKKQIHDSAFENFYTHLKKVTAESYEKNFTAAELEELLRFFESTVGSKYFTKQYEINEAQGKAYVNLQQFTIEAIESVKPQKKSEAVIHLEEKVKTEKKSAKDLLDEYINFDGISIVKFSAVWCGPCKRFAPIFDALAQEMNQVTIDNKKIMVKYIAVDIDQSSDVANQYKVRSVPTVIFFKNGKLVETITGFKSHQEMIAKIKEIAQQ